MPKHGLGTPDSDTQMNANDMQVNSLLDAVLGSVKNPYNPLLKVLKQKERDVEEEIENFRKKLYSENIKNGDIFKLKQAFAGVKEIFGKREARINKKLKIARAKFGEGTKERLLAEERYETDKKNLQIAYDKIEKMVRDYARDKFPNDADIFDMDDDKLPEFEKRLKRYAQRELGIDDYQWEKQTQGVYAEGSSEAEFKKKRFAELQEVQTESNMFRSSGEFQQKIKELNKAIWDGNEEAVREKADSLNKILEDRFKDRLEMKEKVLSKLMDETDGANALYRNNKEAFKQLAHLVSKTGKGF